MSVDAGAVAAGGDSVAHHHGFGRGLAICGDQDAASMPRC